MEHQEEEHWEDEGQDDDWEQDGCDSPREIVKGNIAEKGIRNEYGSYVYEKLVVDHRGGLKDSYISSYRGGFGGGLFGRPAHDTPQRVSGMQRGGTQRGGTNLRAPRSNLYFLQSD